MMQHQQWRVFYGSTQLGVIFAQMHSAAHQMAHEAEKRTDPKAKPVMPSPLPPQPIRFN